VFCRRSAIAFDLTPRAASSRSDVEPGHYATAVRRVTGADVWDVDQSGQMALRASLGGLQDRVVVAQAEQLPFSSDLFDPAYNVDVIHHLQSRTRAICEAFRIPAPGE
jgi:ubiquinone/menaquinone biosynthesis C-methylase UbiE